MGYRLSTSIAESETLDQRRSLASRDSRAVPRRGVTTFIAVRGERAWHPRPTCGIGALVWKQQREATRRQGIEARCDGDFVVPAQAGTQGVRRMRSANREAGGRETRHHFLRAAPEGHRERSGASHGGQVDLIPGSANPWGRARSVTRAAGIQLTEYILRATPSRHSFAPLFRPTPSPPSFTPPPPGSPLSREQRVRPHFVTPPLIHLLRAPPCLVLS